MWRESEVESGQALLEQSDGLLIGPPDRVVVGGTLRAARRHGIEVEEITAAEVRVRFPAHTGITDEPIAVWEPSAGLLKPEAAIRAAVAVAERGGARIHLGSKVVAVE